MISRGSGKLDQIFRHPIKAHGREALASVRLFEGAAMPWDRHWAVTHAKSKFDVDAPAWTSCAHFQRAARTPEVQGIESQFDPETGVMVLRHPARPDLTFRPESEGGAFIDWLAPISPTGDFAPKALVAADVALTDSAYPTLSVACLASNVAVGAQLGADISPLRWRGNLWLSGFAAWEEFNWIGRRLRIGDVTLEIREKIGRCKATMVEPTTGKVDLDTLGALRALHGAQDFGVYASVVHGGVIRRGDEVEVL